MTDKSRLGCNVVTEEDGSKHCLTCKDVWWDTEEEDDFEVTENNDSAGFVELANELGMEFERLCVERHEKGQLEYGKFTFLENDVVRMMVEELADTVNYCRYQAVKLMLLQTALEEQLVDSPLLKEGDDSITIGVKAFKGVGEVGWKK